MEIKILENQNQWNKFLDDNNYLSFLQDFEYGEVEKNLGREILRLGIFENDLIGVCQLIGYQGKRGKGLVCHHGPVIKKEHFENGLSKILEFLKENNYFKKYDFLRINLAEPENLKIDFKKIGFILAPTYAVSENFWIKEIKNDEEMLKEMNDRHRKAVLDSLKKPFLEIEKTDNLEKFETFWSIYEDLAKRKNFVPYQKEFIKKEFEIFAKENKALFFLGKVENKYYSVALIIFSHKLAFYHHSASYPIKEPLNYKLQWEIIQEAKKRGCKFYNFWGIARKETSRHPWYGLTQFKKGFGGELIKLFPTIDYRFSGRYWLIYFWEKLKRKKL
ncbi:MAG: hypothetical protein KatS3mg097_396 [Candidatus Parcubacteria bacterium]|nr:MAG: hypothetical protein KatS3mg097_396 [Candidatus Parcubacteria bacterium]